MPKIEREIKIKQPPVKIRGERGRFREPPYSKGGWWDTNI
jgi:hypothetical protein